MTVWNTLTAAPATVDPNEKIVIQMTSGGSPFRLRTWQSLLTYFLPQVARDKLSGIGGGATTAADADTYLKSRANHDGQQAIGTVTGLEEALNAKVGRALAATATPAENGEMTFELTSNTSITIKAKGLDGTVRSVVLTLS